MREIQWSRKKRKMCERTKLFSSPAGCWQALPASHSPAGYTQSFPVPGLTHALYTPPHPNSPPRKWRRIPLHLYNTCSSLREQGFICLIPFFHTFNSPWLLFCFLSSTCHYCSFPLFFRLFSVRFAGKSGMCLIISPQLKDKK